MTVFRLEEKLDGLIFIVPRAKTKVGAFSPKGAPRSFFERYARVRHTMLSLI
jgi:hypothetical protein